MGCHYRRVERWHYEVGELCGQVVGTGRSWRWQRGAQARAGRQVDDGCDQRRRLVEVAFGERVDGRCVAVACDGQGFERGCGVGARVGEELGCCFWVESVAFAEGGEVVGLGVTSAASPTSRELARFTTTPVHQRPKSRFRLGPGCRLGCEG